MLTIIFLPGIVMSQERYQDQIADSVQVDTYSYAIKDGEDLGLDIYQPYGDTASNRVMIIYVHGGGFTEGTRDDKTSVEFCRQLAGLGYVSVSMSYRLTRKDSASGFGCDCPAVDKINTFGAAVQDIQDATYFLIENRAQFRINPQKIILAGSSAGAEAILSTGYQPPMCYDLPSGPVAYAGLISMAGAIPDTTVMYDESVVPTMFFHGTCDDVVPYATGPHRYCKESDAGYLIMYGSYTLAQKLHDLNKPYWLYSVCGAGHEMASIPMTRYFDDIKEFCYQYIIKGKGEFRNTVVPGDQASCTHGQYDFCNQ